MRKRFEAGKDLITCQNCDERVPLIDFIERRLKSDPVARKILAMEETATRQLDTQALEQILIGHVQAVTGEANRIFRMFARAERGIDGEIELKDDDGRPSGKKVYVALRTADGRAPLDVNDDWLRQPVDVYLIRWMNVSRALDGKRARRIAFDGEDLTMKTVWRLRDRFFRPSASP